MSDLSNTLQLLERLEAGDPLAIQFLWESYFNRLAAFAHSKLAKLNHSLDDGEDIALSAFKNFYDGVCQGRFPCMNDAESLWKVLVAVTRNQLYRSIRDQNRLKRGRNWRQLTSLNINGDNLDVLEDLAHSEPAPEMKAQHAEECARLLDKLCDPKLVELAHLKVAGYTNKDIAKRWGKGERTIERKLQLIRQLWLSECSAATVEQRC